MVDIDVDADGSIIALDADAYAAVDDDVPLELGFESDCADPTTMARWYGRGLALFTTSLWLEGGPAAPVLKLQDQDHAALPDEAPAPARHAAVAGTGGVGFGALGFDSYTTVEDVGGARPGITAEPVRSVSALPPPVAAMIDAFVCEGGGVGTTGPAGVITGFSDFAEVVCGTWST